MSADVVRVQDVAAGIIQGDGVIRRIRGCNVVRTGVGVYVVTINPNNIAGPELSSNESVSKVNIVVRITFVNTNVELVHTSNTVKTISIRDIANAPIDMDFSFRLSRLLG